MGAGLGEFSAQFEARDRLILTDTDPYCLGVLRERFRDRADVEVRELDLTQTLRLESPVDTVLAMNVLEHIEDDVEALRGMATLVRDGGSVILWVPAYQALYGDFDRKVGHVRRYTPKTLRRTVEGAGLTAQVLHPVNLLGGLAWFAAVRLRRAGEPKPSLVRLYDRLVVPVTRALERRITPPFGQSILCVAIKPAEG